MNPATSLIREKIVAAVPEIMELKFGCEIKREGASKREFFVGQFGDEFSIVRIDDKGAWIPFTIPWPPKSQHFEILGRPIRLSDVLVAIGKQGKTFPFSIGFTRGDFISIIPENGTSKQHAVWNCRKDSLDDQSPETLQFIHSILCV